MPEFPEPIIQDDCNAYDQPPKVWELHDPFQYAPPKSDGDSWHIILEPLLKKDRMRCDAWKDEVQNLLIFAGLFSAVATAFVIESYKSLQADPVVGLLQVITASQTNTSGVPTMSPFSPTASSIRVNIFWFLSLVLSLTTVLIGIVSLQWLREHQTYTGLTPKQKFAIFHMRSEGLEKWHVSRIFHALPLLLQAALVLFFAGMIDFLFALQQKVAIPIVVVIGLTSIFLVATTVLPTLQGFAFYFPLFYSAKCPPSQCAYKSPQSQAFRTLSQGTFRILSFLVRRFGSQSTRRSAKSQQHIIPHIAPTWSQSTWIKFDFAWIDIRDAYIQGVHDRQPDLDLHRSKWKSELSLFDIGEGLRKAVDLEGLSETHTELYLAAVHYCFEEVSLSIMNRNKSFNDVDGFGNQERRNRYFRRIIEANGGDVDKAPARQSPVANPTISDVLYLNNGWGLRGWEAWEVLHHENMLVFLSQVVLTRHTSPTLSTHAMELQMRMVRDLLGKPRKIKEDRDLKGTDQKGRRKDIQIFIDSEGYPPTNLPRSLLIDYVGFRTELSKCRDLDTRAVFCFQFANVVKTFFESVADSPVDLNGHEQSLDTFHTHRQMLTLVTEAGWISSYVMSLVHKLPDGLVLQNGYHEPKGNIPTSFSVSVTRHIIEVFIANFNFISERLAAEMHELNADGVRGFPSQSATTTTREDVAAQGLSMVHLSGNPLNAKRPPYDVFTSTEPTESPSLLFYVACLYIKPFTQQHHEEKSPIRKALDSLIPVMRRYYFVRLKLHHHSDSAQLFVGTTPDVLHSLNMGVGTIKQEETMRPSVLEDRWSGSEEYGVERFSEEWWRFISAPDEPRRFGLS